MAPRRCAGQAPTIAIYGKQFFTSGCEAAFQGEWRESCQRTAAFLQQVTASVRAKAGIRWKGRFLCDTKPEYWGERARLRKNEP